MTTTLPSAVLSWPARHDRTLAALVRNARELALRTLLGARDPEIVAMQWEVARLVKTDRAQLLERVGSPDVLPLLLTNDVKRALPSVLQPRPASPHLLRPGIEFSLHDANPLAMLEAHPEKAGNAVDLAGHSVDEWLTSLRHALDVIDDVIPEWAAELPLALQRVVPVGYDAEKHLSASYREAPGLIYLTLHPDPLTLTEAIVHEVQHGKLNLLTWADPVLENAFTTWTKSPVRPDLRPIMGVLLAAHAFVPVAALHLALAEYAHPISETGQFAERRRQVLVGNTSALALLREHAVPTERGRKVIEDLTALHLAILAATPEEVRPGVGDESLPPG